MLYIIKYDQDYKRTIPAVLIENRASIPAIKNEIGTVIKGYTDGEVAKVTENVVPYKIFTATNGVLVGFFTIQLSNNGQDAVKFQEVLRPAFQPFSSDIDQNIAIFITNGQYKQDILI